MRKLLFILLFSGCMMGPDYTAPEVAVSDTWVAEGSEEAPDRWWETFEDEMLNRYIEEAAAHNYDVASAEQNILAARALKTMAASKLFPQVSFNMQGLKTYFSKNGPVFTFDFTEPGIPFGIQAPQIQNLFSAVFDVSWELDLFGKTRRSVEAAAAEVESLIAKKDDVLLSVMAEVAKNYVELRGYQKQLRLTEQNVALIEERRAILAASVAAGLVNQIDVETCEADLAKAQADLPDVHSAIYQSIFALGTLVGKEPEALAAELIEEKEMPRPTVLMVGSRSDMLRRRPDVREAERTLALATAEIGVAVASFFPTVSLVADGGFQSLILPKLFNWSSRTWDYGTNIAMPVFEGGEQIGQLHLTQAAARSAAALYQKTVLNALQEAESNLMRFRDYEVKEKALSSDVLHTTYVVAISKERFLKGLVSKLSFIDNERQLIAAELNETVCRMNELTALISLYKALGGGFK